MGKVFYFECDCCKKQSLNEADFEKVDVPSRIYDALGEKFTPGFASLMLCKKCSQTLWKLSDMLFAKVEVGGEKVVVFPNKEAEILVQLEEYDEIF